MGFWAELLTIDHSNFDDQETANKLQNIVNSLTEKTELEKTQINNCDDLPEERKGKEDCYSTKPSDDPMVNYFKDLGFIEGEPTNCIAPTPTPSVSVTPEPTGTGNCGSYGSVTGKVPWPIDSNQITGTYGDSVHPGIDFTAAEGTPVYAVGDGEVVFTRNTADYTCYPFNPSCGSNFESSPVDQYKGWYSAYGNMVGIKNKDGVTVYAHLKKGSVTVQKGDCVKMNDQIAQVGNTGNSSNPHIHFEIVKIRMHSLFNSMRH
jgi:hypothetical protein